VLYVKLKILFKNNGLSTYY